MKRNNFKLRTDVFNVVCKNRGFVLVFLLLFSLTLVSASTPGNIAACQTLDTAGTYRLTSNLQGGQVNSSAGVACFYINTSNVVLNCQNYLIRNSTLGKPAIYAYGVSNISILNCDVAIRGETTSGEGVNFREVNNSRISNGIFNFNNIGIYLNQSNNVTVYNNTGNYNIDVDFQGFVAGTGIFIENGGNHNISFNSFNHNQGGRGVSSSETEGYGAYLFGVANVVLFGNNFNNNTGNNFDYGSNGIGSYIWSSLNVSLISNNIFNNTALDDGSEGGGGIGVQIESSNNTFILGNQIKDNHGARGSAIGGEGVGIYFGLNSQNYNSKLINNTIVNNYPGNGVFANELGYGIYGIAGAYDSFISNNTIETHNRSVYLASYNGVFSENRFVGCIAYSCFSIIGGRNNTVQGGRISGNSELIYLSGVNGSVFKDVVLNVSAGRNNTVLTGNSVNNTFVNMSYNSTFEQVFIGSSLYRAWYYRAQVNSTANVGLNGVEILIYNSTNNLAYNFTTGSDGFTSINYLAEYMNNRTITYFLPYNITLKYGNAVFRNLRVYNTSSQGNNLFDTYTIDAFPPSVQLSAPDDGVSSSRPDYNFTFTATDTNSSLLNCSLNFDSVIVNSNASTSSGVLTSLNFSSMGTGSHFWNVTCLDNWGNSNTSEVRSIMVDVSAPNITNIVINPSDLNLIDPRSNVSFNVTILDGSNVSAVLLEVNNGTRWFNNTMYRVAGTNVYRTNITLVSSDQNYTYRIIANDSLNNRNSTVDFYFSSYWDCSFEINPSNLGTTGGFYERKLVGNITLSNTGDYEHSNNNCLIEFSGWNSYTNLSGSYWSQNTWPGDGNRGLEFESGGTTVSSLNVNASTNKTLEVFGRFPLTSSVLEEFPYFKISSDIRNTINNATNETVTMKMIITPGAYLEVGIENTPQTIYLTPGNTTLSGYLKNIADPASNLQNNTAHNVSFNWTLPTSILERISSGNINNTYSSLLNTTKQSNNLVLEFSASNLASMSQSMLVLRVAALGYENSTGSFNLIRNSNNLTLFSATQNVSLLCYNTTDSVCVSACGRALDPDCPEVSLESESASSGSGGGGGGGGGGSQLVSSKAEYEFTRGKSSQIVVVYENKNFNEELKDLEFSLRGNLAKYMEIVPSSLDSLGPREKVSLKIIVSSPGFIPLGIQQIQLLVSAKLGNQNYNEQKIITLNINEISKEEALDLLDQSEYLLIKFNDADFYSEDLNALFDDSKKAMDELDYSVVKENYELIKHQVDSALNARKIIRELNQLIKEAKQKDIDVSGSERIIKLAILALERNDFERAFARAKEAQVTYALEVKGELASFSYYLKNNPREISLSLMFLILFTYGSYKLTKFQLIKNRIKKLEKDEKILQELMKAVQREAFQEKRMSMEEYKNSISYYETRMAHVVEKLIELNSLKTHNFSFSSKAIRLKNEKESIINLIKQLQENYLNKGNIETRSYELKLGSYNKRLGEIDSDLATDEAKKAFRKIGFFKSFSEFSKFGK